MTGDAPDLTGYDDSSAAGYICEECGALVPRMPSFTTRHTDWHRKLVNIVTASEQSERRRKGLGGRGG
jgi:hypothetical protein